MPRIVQILGYMRSGTSMCRKLLHSHPDIYITNELGRMVYPELVKFLSKADALFGDMPSSRSRQRWKDRKTQLTVDMWLGLSKFDEDEHAARRARVVGNKTPRAEFHVPQFEEYIKPVRPLYVYCLRDPVKVLRSKLNMHLSNRNFEYSFKDLENSIGRAFAMQDAMPDRVFMFSVDAYSGHPAAVTTSLLEFLGVASDPGVVADMIAQPAANTMSQQLRSRQVSGESVEAITELSPEQLASISGSAVLARASTMIDRMLGRLP